MLLFGNASIHTLTATNCVTKHSFYVSSDTDKFNVFLEDRILPSNHFHWKLIRKNLPSNSPKIELNLLTSHQYPLCFFKICSGYNQLSALLTQSKKTEQRQWLKDVSSVPLQQSLRHLDVAYRNFFNSRNGKHKGKKSGLPKFKKKTNNQTAEFTKAAFSVSGEYVYLAKIGDIKPVWCRKLPSAPSSVTAMQISTSKRRF